MLLFPFRIQKSFPFFNISPVKVPHPFLTVSRRKCHFLGVWTTRSSFLLCHLNIFISSTSFFFKAFPFPFHFSDLDSSVDPNAYERMYERFDEPGDFIFPPRLHRNRDNFPQVRTGKRRYGFMSSWMISRFFPPLPPGRRYVGVFSRRVRFRKFHRVDT